LVWLLDTCPDRKPDEWALFHRQGQPLGDFKHAWHAALTRAGFSHLEKQPDGTTRTVYDRTFHDFRRTAARNLVRRGVREGVAMDVTGHRTRSTFDRYNITSTDDVPAAMEGASLPTRDAT
jgi:integrase